MRFQKNPSRFSFDGIFPRKNPFKKWGRAVGPPQAQALAPHFLEGFFLGKIPSKEKRGGFFENAS